MKDNFSGHAEEYAKFRPKYPDRLYELILSFCKERKAAWDCATGNGQVAVELSVFFEQVEASDISVKQLLQAPQIQNVRYSVQPAENTNFRNNSFDLITVAQAVHWFDFEPFFQEAKRTLKPNGVIALVGYGLMEVEGLTDLVDYFYHEIIGDFWDPERKYIDDKYQTIPFPFVEVETPQLFIEGVWNKEQLLGYLNTWSAVKHYEKTHGENPLLQVNKRLTLDWGDVKCRKVRFPLIIRMGLNS